MGKCDRPRDRHSSTHANHPVLGVLAGGGGCWGFWGAGSGFARKVEVGLQGGVPGLGSGPGGRGIVVTGASGRSWWGSIAGPESAARGSGTMCEVGTATPQLDRENGWLRRSVCVRGSRTRAVRTQEALGPLGGARLVSTQEAFNVRWVGSNHDPGMLPFFLWRLGNFFWVTACQGGTKGSPKQPELLSVSPPHLPLHNVWACGGRASFRHVHSFIAKDVCLRQAQGPPLGFRRVHFDPGNRGSTTNPEDSSVEVYVLTPGRSHPSLAQGSHHFNNPFAI